MNVLWNSLQKCYFKNPTIVVKTNILISKLRYALILLGIAMITCCQTTDSQKEPGWPAQSRETKPWTRWWWHGSAVTKEGITSEMEAYKKAGLGGLEITPIYGVHGQEDQFVDYLSPQWIDLLLHTLREAERLDLGIDMATGTGWPFGGPGVGDDDASKNLQHKVYKVQPGERLKERITFVQQPYLRAVGNQVYEVHDSFSTEKSTTQGTRSEPLMQTEHGNIAIAELQQPISRNKNLQALAIDQVVFERRLPLKGLMAYSSSGKILDLMGKVDDSGTLDWTAPDEEWTLYAVFEGYHGKMVERAGPGGEGMVIDHFSKTALTHYLSRFDSAFKGKNISSLRAFFNDSYEVDDARGAADWTPGFFEAFRKRRGYNLEDHLPALFGDDDPEKNRRILCDYRQTISELVLHNFTEPWKEWAHSKSAIIRNQAHGSPSNILDLYATVDIPEIEGVEPLRMKMASSAGNVSGKKLVSSESATWLNEHFESNLADIKVALDRFMINGVNHVFYHGTCYSPPGEPWPGRLFYAAVHLNPRNSLWPDFGALNAYVSRCQSFLQNSTPDNDILLYYPLYDRFSTPGNEMIEHFDGIGKQFDGTAFKRSAEFMLHKGYAFDYISDNQIENMKVEQGQLLTESGGRYATLVIAQCQYIPATTFQKIVSLARQGATILFPGGLPLATSGYGDLEKNEEMFGAELQKIKMSKVISQDIEAVKLGEGNIFISDSLASLLEKSMTRRETMVDKGIQYIRKKGSDGETIYFMVNSSDTPFDGWLPVTEMAGSFVLFDPIKNKFGAARTRKNPGNGQTELYLRLAKQETLILEAYAGKVTTAPYRYYDVSGTSVPLGGKWAITFTDGGPTIPPKKQTDSLLSWTLFGAVDYPEFSGTASYALTFNKPDKDVSRWELDLGMVHESATVFLNGKELGTLIGPVYRIAIDGSLFEDQNFLEVKVSNLMANRIAYMDKRNIFWKKFYNVNFPSRKAENRSHGIFDASQWQPRNSGLLGPVQLLPLTEKDFSD